jgi:hypothetical protein
MDCYRVTVRLAGPLCAGSFTMGFVQRARHYLPARTVWGVLTAHATRAMRPGGALEGHYRTVGDAIRDGLPTTHFFPDVNEGNGPWYVPWYGETGLTYGGGDRAAFEDAFIVSRARTAIEPTNLGAEDGSLHDMEFLTDRTRHEGLPVFLTGYAFAGPGVAAKCGQESVDALLRLLDGAQVGAERKYGFGLLRDCRTERVDPSVVGLFGRSVTWENERLTIRSGDALPFHVPLSEATQDYHGDVEPLVWRQWGSHAGGTGFGQEVKRQKNPDGGSPLCWVPGSVAPTRGVFVPGPFGVFTPYIPTEGA